MKIPLYYVHLNELNPRKDFGDIYELAESIRKHGLLEPIKVVPCNCDRRNKSHYRLVDGHRRLRALHLLGRTELNDGEYMVYSLSKQEEIVMMVETNIKRKSYTPAELYNAIQLERKYGVLKDLTEKTGMKYARLRQLVSVLDRLHPILREKVVWKKSNNDDDERISFREACEIASVSYPYQFALAGAHLTHKQLTAAVKKIREKIGMITPEEAIIQARNEVEDIDASNKVTAAYVAALIAVTRGKVRINDLVKYGFSKTTAQRTLSYLEKKGMLVYGKVSSWLMG